MFDVEVRNDVENWIFIKRFSAIPRVGEQVLFDVGAGETEYTVIKVTYKQSEEDAQVWASHVNVLRSDNA